jgi:hypothetical protein
MGARSVGGLKFDAAVPAFNIDVPGVQEWNIKGATNHPFHLHVYHYQMQDACGSGGAFEDGEYYDTIAGSCLVRLDSNPATTTAYDGRTIMHCHILEHEDQGAMIWADQQTGGFGPPAFPDPSTQFALYDCDSGTTTTTTTASTTSTTSTTTTTTTSTTSTTLAGQCSDYEDKPSCNADPNCSWSNRFKVCEPIGGQSAGIWKESIQALFSLRGIFS